MPNMMKAVRYYGPGDIRVERIEEPEPKPGQVKIKIAWNAVSSTDLHMYQVPLTGLAPTATKPNRLTGERLPITLGHEFSGNIAALGEGVDTTKWRPGQKVAVAPLLACMKTATCPPCAAEHYNVCPKATFIGVGGRGGGLAEYIAVDVQHVHALPAEVSLEVGAMLEPLAIALHAVKRSGFKPGQTALISGAGLIGLLMLQVLRSIDPGALIVVSEPIEFRRKLALKWGATEVVDPNSSRGVVLAIVYGETNGVGVDIVFETGGTQESLDTALMCVKPHGTLVNVAIWQRSPSVNLNLVNSREIRLTGTMGYGDAYPRAIEAVASGEISGIEELVTKKISIGAVVGERVLALLTAKDNQVKVLVHP